MNLPYIPRLICAALACFVLVYAVAAAAVALCAPVAIRAAGRRAPQRAARFLLTLRLLPLCLAGSAVAGLCIPSYLWFEPEPFEEPVGLVCIAIALLGLALCGFTILRAAKALVHSALFARRCRQLGHPCLALTGIVRPRIVISQGIADALPQEELDVVMSHEHAHRTSRDNLKRLCILLAPGSKALERAWMRSAEYAADQQAVRGDARRSLALASALVRVARLGVTAGLSFVTTSFLADASELSVRVDRLLSAPQSIEPAPAPFRKLVIAALLIAVLLNTASLRAAHSLIERLMH